MNYNAGSALMGIGKASGEGRALAAARAAIASPLLESSIEGARGILLSIAGSSELGLFEVNESAEIIHDVAHPDANIIFGTVVDESMDDEIRVTVIAAGFDRWDDDAESVTTSDPLVDILDDDPGSSGAVDIFASDDEDDGFDVPSFLK